MVVWCCGVVVCHFSNPSCCFDCVHFCSFGPFRWHTFHLSRSADHDGRNTPGQLKILFGFYCAFICGANIVVCGLALAFNAGSVAALTDTFKDDVLNGNAVSAIYPLLVVLIFMYMLTNAVTMYYSSAIATWYTVLQSLMQVLCVLYSCLSLVLIFGSVYALCMNQFSGANDLGTCSSVLLVCCSWAVFCCKVFFCVGDNVLQTLISFFSVSLFFFFFVFFPCSFPPFFPGLAGPLIFTIIWGIMMFMVNIFGVVTVKSESTKGLKIFAASLFFMGLLLFVGIGLGAQDANKTIDNKVRACGGACQE